MAARRPDHEHIPADSVDGLLASWRERRPDLDFSPVGVLTRLARVRRHVDVELERVFADHRLDAGTFAVLANAARLAGDGTVAEARLIDEIGLPGPALAERLERLEDAGLVVRGPDVALTPHGRSVFDEAVIAHLDNERLLLAALDADEQALLATLLRKLLVEFEGSRPAPGGAPCLGLTVAPAHQAAEVREAVGLPAASGLLVRTVEPDGRAAGAGLRPGDVLIGGGGRELRSIAALYGALDEVVPGVLELRVLRGTDERTVAIDLRGVTRLEGAASPGRAAFPEHVL